jgi:hypothetical protein
LYDPLQTFIKPERYTYEIFIFARNSNGMDTKLTLKLEQSVIEKAKEYAKSQKTSLSRLVENYLLNITSDKDSEEKITPLVKSLSGILDASNETDHRNGYGDFLNRKYS